MPRGKPTDDGTRNAVMAALLAGQGVTEVAAEYKLSKAAVSRLKGDLEAGRVSEFEQLEQLEQIGTDDFNLPNSLISDYLCAGLKSLRVQAEIASDEAYLRRYPPQQLAVLHGIIADKVARIIEAVSGATRPEEGQESQAGNEAEDS